jgi:hypothetical protein
VPQQTICPSCRQPLRVPDDVRSRWLSCPRCLARVANPGAPALLGGRGTADEEVHRDNRGIGIGLTILAILGGLGVTRALLFTAAAGGLAGLATIMVPLHFLGLLTTGIMFWRTRDNPAARNVGRVVVGTLASVGVLVLLALAAVIFLFVLCLTQTLR